MWIEHRDKLSLLFPQVWVGLLIEERRLGGGFEIGKDLLLRNRWIYSVA